MTSSKGEIILYQPNEVLKLEVRLENETVWLSQQQIAELFGTKRQAITRHLKNIFLTEELNESSVCSILEHTAADGKNYATKFYNLDAIISVGYRVNSKNATAFRRWANTVLKDYIIRGYSITHRVDILEQRMEHRFTSYDKQLGDISQKVDFFVHTSLPPIEGSAKERVILIDNFVDESVLLLLGKRKENVSATLYTRAITPQLQQDINRYNSQYPPVILMPCHNFHDRFLIIDDTIYHIGASLKDLGKKLFAFSKMGMSVPELLNHTS